MYQHPHFYHVTNEYFLLKKCIFHDFGIMDLRTTEPFRSDSRTFFSNLRTFGLKNLRTHEPSNLRTFGLIGCNRPERWAVRSLHSCVDVRRQRQRTATTINHTFYYLQLHDYNLILNHTTTYPTGATNSTVQCIPALPTPHMHAC